MKQILIEVTVISKRDGSHIQVKFPMDKGLYEAISSIPNEEERVRYFSSYYEEWNRELAYRKHYGGSLDTDFVCSELSEAIVDEDDPASYCQKKEEAEMLSEAINKLTEKQRKVIILRYIEDVPTKETAKKLRMRSSSVSHIEKRALEKLRVLLEGKF